MDRIYYNKTILKTVFILLKKWVEAKEKHTMGNKNLIVNKPEPCLLYTSGNFDGGL